MNFDKLIYNILESVNEKRIGLLGGGFKPPHKGHYHLLQKLAAVSDKVYVFIGKSPRASADGRVFDQENSKRMWEFYIQNDPQLNTNVEIIFSKITPIKDVYDMIYKGQSGDSFYIATSTKHEEGEPSDLDRYKNLQKYVPQGVGVELFPIEPISSGELGVLSATDFRNAISSKDINTIKMYVPDHIRQKAAEVINI